MKAWVKDRIEFLLALLDLPIDAVAEGRVAKYFGLAYAAGLFAVRAGALPINPKTLRRAIVSVFRSRSADKPPAGTDLVAVVRNFVQRHEAHFHDQRERRPKLVRRGVSIVGYVTSEVRRRFSFTRQLQRLCRRDFASNMSAKLCAMQNFFFMTLVNALEYRNIKPNADRWKTAVYSVSGRI